MTNLPLIGLFAFLVLSNVVPSLDLADFCLVCLFAFLVLFNVVPSLG